jgi:hypothetical protein
MSGPDEETGRLFRRARASIRTAHFSSSVSSWLLSVKRRRKVLNRSHPLTGRMVAL